MKQGDIHLMKNSADAAINASPPALRAISPSDLRELPCNLHQCTQAIVVLFL